MNINEKAASYLRAVATGDDVPGGIRFQKALAQARLDDSPDSLDRISALLRQIHAKIKPSQDDIVPGGDFHNFVLVLAFYLGEVVSQQVKQPIVWYEYDDAVKTLAADYGLPRAPFSEIVGIVGGRVFLPLGWALEVVPRLPAALRARRADPGRPRVPRRTARAPARLLDRQPEPGRPPAAQAAPEDRHRFRNLHHPPGDRQLRAAADLLPT